MSHWILKLLGYELGVRISLILVLLVWIGLLVWTAGAWMKVG